MSKLVTFKQKFNRWLDKYDNMPKSMRKGKYSFVFLMAFPALAGLAVFYFYVNFNSILLAFKDARTNEYSLINFQQLFAEFKSSDTVIVQALKNTLYFFILGSFITPVIGYFVAYFFYKKIPLGSVFRFILFVPGIISGIVVSTLFIKMVSPAGPISYWKFLLTGTPLVDYLHQDDTSIWMILAFCLWTGFTSNVLLLMGTFSRLPSEVLESARLDGATPMQELFLIITPMVWSTISTLFMLSMTGLFTSSGPILLFTNGAYNTYTLSFWIFAQVKDSAIYNYPSAVGLFFTIIGLPIVIGVYKLMGKVQANVEF